MEKLNHIFCRKVSFLASFCYSKVGDSVDRTCPIDLEIKGNTDIAMGRVHTLNHI